MKKALRRVLFVGLFVALSACEQGGPPTSRPETPTHEVTLHQVKEVSVPKVLWLSGEVVAARSITVASKIEGHIRTVLANEGDRVTKGQLLAEIDPSGVEAGIARAEADIVAAKASLADANADVERFRKLAKTQALAEDQLRDARVRAVTERAATVEA